jgi:predicted esterase
MVGLVIRGQARLKGTEKGTGTFSIYSQLKVPVPFSVPFEIHAVPTLTHGRVLVRQARAAASRGLLVGFHGYMEHAAMQMRRLEEIPSAAAWTLVSIQGLHRFYRGRSEEVVASWMTREDRELAIADNLTYVAAALDAVPHDESTRIVYAGFSQGVAMAFRAAGRGAQPAAAVISVGGDVPPELLENASAIPPVLLARGARDEWYTQAKFDADITALNTRGVALTAVTYDGAHEWNAAVTRAIEQYLS